MKYGWSAVRRHRAGHIVIVFVSLQLLCVAMALLFPDSFPYLSGNNVQLLLKSIPPLAIMSLGVGILMIGGEYDLSVGSNFAISSYVMAMAYNAGWPSGLAVLAALATGGAIVLLRGMGQGVRKTRVLGTLMAYLLVLDVAATIVWGFVLPTWWEFGMLGLAGIAFGLGQWAFVLAARAGHANQIAPMQYSQLVWAVGLGALFFGEYVDPVASVGIAVLIASGLATIFVVAPAGAKTAATADRNNSAETGGIRS